MARSPIIRSRRVWRTWLIAYLLFAVAWPATGPLPWLALDAGDHMVSEAFGHGHGSTGATDDDADATQGAVDATPDAADIPGSPTHPLDHHCAQCEVLKHLARCVPSPVCEPSIAPPPGAPVLAFAAMEPFFASFIAARPPIRGPPNLLV